MSFTLSKKPVPGGFDQRSDHRGETIISILMTLVIIGFMITISYKLVGDHTETNRLSYHRAIALKATTTQVERIKAMAIDKDSPIFDYRDPARATSQGSKLVYPKFCILWQTGSNRLEIREIKTPADKDQCQLPYKDGFDTDADFDIYVQWQPDQAVFEVESSWEPGRKRERQKVVAYYRVHGLQSLSLTPVEIKVAYENSSDPSKITSVTVTTKKVLDYDFKHAKFDSSLPWNQKQLINTSDCNGSSYQNLTNTNITETNNATELKISDSNGLTDNYIVCIKGTPKLTQGATSAYLYLHLDITDPPPAPNQAGQPKELTLEVTPKTNSGGVIQYLLVRPTTSYHSHAYRLVDYPDQIRYGLTTSCDYNFFFDSQGDFKTTNIFEPATGGYIDPSKHSGLTSGSQLCFYLENSWAARYYVTYTYP